MDVKSLLKMRAEQLSLAEKSSTWQKHELLEVLEFQLADERYAFELKHLSEVQLIKDVSFLPTAPQFMIGLINVRRKILSLIDLGYFFDLPKNKDVIGKKALILAKNDMEFGILIDTIIAIRAIAVADIQLSLPTLNKVRQEFLKGITNDGLVILDALKLLEYKPLIIDQEL